MKIHEILALITIALYLSGCEHPTGDVLFCEKPAVIVEDISIGAGGGLSISSAKGDLGASLSKKLSAEFATAHPDSWISIMKTFQYQSCQLINSASCGDLLESECMDKKQTMLNDTHDKIFKQLNDEKEKIKSAAAKQSKIIVDSCVANRIALYEAPKNTHTSGGARAAAPGFGGGRNTDTENVCHSVGANQKIISATTTVTSCHGGRCSVTDPSFENENTRVCVTTEAWSESNSGGAGGSAKYRLNVVYRNVATSGVINGFRATCASKGI